MIFGQKWDVPLITPDELGQVIENRPTPFSEYVGGVFRQGIDYGPVGAVYNAPPEDDIVSRGRYGPARSGVPVLSEDEWKASPDYREAIPFDGRMTVARAKAKAEVYDKNAYNTWLRQNRPWGVGTVAGLALGTVAAGAVDPTSYIPAFGPAVRAANATRLGVVMARAGIGAAENMAITALMSPAIAQSRQQFGDDITFADQLIDIAVAGAFGAVVGGVAGRFERLHDGSPNRIASALQTMGEAADSLADDLPINVMGAHRMAQSFEVYHGSPHTFEAFSMDRIGTGEGASTFGHGLYFAENRRVAENYQTRLAKPGEGNIYQASVKGSVDQLLDRDLPLHSQPPAVIAALESIPGIKEKFAALARDDADLLAQLTDESVSPNNLPIMSGAEFYDQLSRALGSDEKASAALRDAGIIGMRYLDQQSRNAGGWHITPPDQTVKGKWMVKSSDYNSKGEHFDTEAEAKAALEEKTSGDTRNLVLFSDKDISIVSRNGQPVAPRSIGSQATDASATDPVRAAAAEAAVGKPAKWTDAALKETAETHGINPETGEFPELAEIKRLDTAERLTERDREQLDAADAEVKRTDEYRKVYEAAAACLVRAA